MFHTCCRDRHHLLIIDKATADKILRDPIGYGCTVDASTSPRYILPLVTNHWSQNTAKIKFIGMKEGGMGQAQGARRSNIYHDPGLRVSKETILVLDAQAKKYGFTGHPHPRAPPGHEQAQVAAGAPDQARLGDPARLGRDEPDGAQGGGWLRAGLRDR